MSKFVSIKEASSFLGVSTQTLRRWDRQGKLVPAKRTKGDQRRYDITQLMPAKSKDSSIKELPTIAYARVSSYDQKEDLQRQMQMLEYFCTSHGWVFEVIADLGSGNYYGFFSKVIRFQKS